MSFGFRYLLSGKKFFVFIVYHPHFSYLPAFPESDLDEIGKRTVVILELRKYYNLTYKYQGKIGINSLKTKKEKSVSKKNEGGKQ